MQAFTAVPPGIGYYGSTPVERSSPPSTYAVAAVLEREPGSFVRLVGVTAIRAIFVFPGIWIAGKLVNAGLPLWKTGVMSLLASTTITGGMLAWYALKRLGSRGSDLPPVGQMPELGMS